MTYPKIIVHVKTRPCCHLRTFKIRGGNNNDNNNNNNIILLCFKTTQSVPNKSQVTRTLFPVLLWAVRLSYFDHLPITNMDSDRSTSIVMNVIGTLSCTASLSVLLVYIYSNEVNNKAYGVGGIMEGVLDIGDIY